MAFRKKVKKILSKLHHSSRNKSSHSPNEKHVSSRPSTATTTETVRPSGTNVYQQSRSVPAKPPALRADSEFPQRIDPNYNPSGTFAKETGAEQVENPKTVREHYNEGANVHPEKLPQRHDPFLESDSRTPNVGSSAASRPERHDDANGNPNEHFQQRESLLGPNGPGRTMSNVTAETQASSDYDQHCLFPPNAIGPKLTDTAITHSLHASSIPSAGRQMMENFQERDNAPPVPVHPLASGPSSASRKSLHVQSQSSVRQRSQAV
jgi:hypothetical protein